MFKGSGITKSTKKKWDTSVKMETKDIVLNKVHASQSTADGIEEDVHFVINSDFKITSSVPERKPTELPHKTFPKKPSMLVHPYMSSDMLEPFRDSLSAKERLQSPLTLKCTAVTSEGKPHKKLKRDSNSASETRMVVTKKLQKRNLQPKVQRFARSRSAGTPSSNNDSDSDIEILAVYSKSQSMVSSSRGTGIKRSINDQVHVQNRKGGQVFATTVNSSVAVNKANAVPLRPSNPAVHSDANSRASSFRWLSSNGKVTISPLESNGSVGGLLSKSIQNVSKTPMFLPELKAQTKEKPKGKREMKSLYDNLNEISWAQESSFKNLLRNPDTIKGGKGRIGKTGKNLRNLKPAVKLETLSGKRAAKVKASQLMARKKSKMARKLNQKTQANRMQKKNTVLATLKKKRLGKQVVNGADKKKSAKPVANSGAVESDTNEETDILYSLPPTVPEVKVEIPDVKPKIEKMKLDPARIKQEVPRLKSSLLKLKSEAQKTKTNIYKLKPDALKPKSSGLKLKPDGPKTKSNLLKPEGSVKKPFVTQIKPEYSPPSTSGLQKTNVNAKSTANAKNADVKNFLKNFDNFEFSQGVQLLQSLYEDDKSLYSDMQKSSKLRVSLQPLEHTNLWNSQYYDECWRIFLEDAVRKAVENHDKSPTSMMYQMLHDNANLQANNKAVANPIANRVAKRKRLGEEEALRSSARQSEGAFRYKEIVVKKHPNYVQVVLVPNEVKQNSLTIEAIKELKDVFLLAKKDPNCNAVLLNSSGKYFCTGLDLSPLVGSNKKQVAEELSNSVHDLVLTLGMFTKPIIAAVNGSAIGFGVSLLTYCDVVLASDKATFCLPAAKIGYIPEGGVTLTLPQVVGSSVASEMLLQGRRLTAEQALRNGLVTEILWPTSLMNDVIPRLKAITSYPSQAMEATKTMVRYHLWDKLKSHVDRERRLLCEQWLTSQCQQNIKNLLQTGWID